MDHLLTRFALALGVVTIGAIFLGSAAVFLFAALYLALAPMTGEAGAAALTGLAALIAAVFSLLIGRLILSPDHHQRAALHLAAQRGDPHLAQELSALLGKELGKAFHEHPKGAAGAALAAGFAIGLSPELRRLLLGLFGGR